jgi:hypothetical protein
MEPSKKRLFTVQIVHEIVVVADDASSAEKRMLVESINDFGPPEISAVPLCCLPADWDEDSIPFGDEDPSEPDRTVGGWMKLGAAPDYEALRAKLARTRNQVE